MCVLSKECVWKGEFALFLGDHAPAVVVPIFSARCPKVAGSKARTGEGHEGSSVAPHASSHPHPSPLNPFTLFACLSHIHASRPKWGVSSFTKPSLTLLLHECPSLLLHQFPGPVFYQSTNYTIIILLHVYYLLNCKLSEARNCALFIWILKD